MQPADLPATLAGGRMTTRRTPCHNILPGTRTRPDENGMTKHIDDLVSHAGAVVHDLRAILMDAEITPDELELAQSAAKALAEVLGGMSCTLTVRMARRRAV